MLVIGFLLAAVFLLPSTDDGVQGLSVQAVRLASWWAVVWCVATIALFFLNVSDIFAEPLVGTLRAPFITGYAETSAGRAVLLQALGAALVAVAARWTLGTKALAGILGLALATLAPITLTGHAASSGSHDLATISLLLHVVGRDPVGRRSGRARLGGDARQQATRRRRSTRFSTLASLGLRDRRGVSGLVNASVRLGSFDELFGSTYGRLVLLKVVALVVLGVFGYVQRRRIVAKGAGFLRLATTELLRHGGDDRAGRGTLAHADARRRRRPERRRSRSCSVVRCRPRRPCSAMLWGWTGNGVGLAIVGLGTALYLSGVWTLRKRGDAWPLGRTISWLIGMVVIAWATFGGLGVYSHVLFSAHMASHMMLSMVAPIFLVLGAPMTLALRTLPGPRQPGEVSPRAMLQSFLHSRFAQVHHPSAGRAAAVRRQPLRPLLQRRVRDPDGQPLGTHGHGAALPRASALLYYYVLIGIDPSPRTLPSIARFGMLIVTIPFHAFFAIAVMSSSSVFAGDYWRALDRPYRTDLLADQYLGGGMAWAMGEIPLILVMGALLWQWFRSDAREAKRFDRSEDRTDDAALEAYNARLRDLAEHGKRRDP